MHSTSAARVSKLLALAVSAALIGSPAESAAAYMRAESIAEANGLDIVALARAAGARHATSSTFVVRRGEPCSYARTRSLSRDEKVELCTSGRDGRTEVYVDLEDCGRRDWIGYLDELDAAALARVASLSKLHAQSHASYWR